MKATVRQSRKVSGKNAHTSSLMLLAVKKVVQNIFCCTKANFVRFSHPLNPIYSDTTQLDVYS